MGEKLNESHKNQITTPMIKLSQIRTSFHLLAVITHQKHSENQASSTFPHSLISFHHINPISSRNLSSLPAGTCVLSGTAKLEKTTCPYLRQTPKRTCDPVSLAESEDKNLSGVDSNAYFRACIQLSELMPLVRGREQTLRTSLNIQ